MEEYKNYENNIFSPSMLKIVLFILTSPYELFEILCFRNFLIDICTTIGCLFILGVSFPDSYLICYNFEFTYEMIIKKKLI